MEILAPSAALDVYYIRASGLIRDFENEFGHEYRENLSASDLMERFFVSYDGFLHGSSQMFLHPLFLNTSSAGRDAFLDMCACGKLQFPSPGAVHSALHLFSITSNRADYDKICSALDFQLEFDKNGQVTRECKDRIGLFDSSFRTSDEEFLAGFKVRLDRAVASLSTCPMMKRGDSKEALPEIIDCVRELHRRASSND